MFQVIPAIGTIFALAAFFFAVYYRTIQRFSKIGADGVKELGNLPVKSRLDATKVLINVFDLDVDRLTPDQQFQLALRTFEKRERESKRNFLLTLAGGAILLIFAAGFWLSKLDGGKMVRSALTADRTNAVAAINDEGFFKTTDTKLVDNLAKSAVVDRSIQDPFERAERFEASLARQPSVVELRDLASADKAPFEDAGDILLTSVPSRADQPPRYIAFVRRQSNLAGRMISVRSKGRQTYLRLYAQGAVDSDSPVDLQINYEQFRELFGDKPVDIRKALVTASSDPDAFDPTCPRYPGFSITSCDLPPRLSQNSIPARATN